jgi:uncharacterized protein YcaQ
MLTFSLSAARNLILAVQGLSTPPDPPTSREDVLACIRRIGALQIDTIHVLARAPYFILWSRLGEYPLDWLNDLLAERQIFEYWAHAACCLPMEDYPLYRRMMLARSWGWWGQASEWLEANAVLADSVLARIRQEGALRSADFENPDHTPGGWWEWKKEKLALEYLFSVGELMIARRDKFQRIYDLHERILPDWDDARAPSIEAVRRELALRTLRCLGVAHEAWVADYFRLAKKGLPQILEGLAAEGALLPAEIEGLPGRVYLHPDHAALAQAAVGGALQPTLTTLLSPFDPLVWDRQRGRQLFGFDYTIECYTPAEKRRYGYFSLPILSRGALVGRLDAKAHRQKKVFEVRSLHLEEGVQPEAGLAADLADALRRCAEWHSTPQVILPPGCEWLGSNFSTP